MKKLLKLLPIFFAALFLNSFAHSYQNMVVDGSTYPFPVTDDEEWGDYVTDWADAVTDNLVKITSNTRTSTTTITSQLNSTITIVTNRLNNLDSSTGNITTRLDNLDSSTATITTSLDDNWTSTLATYTYLTQGNATSYININAAPQVKSGPITVSSFTTGGLATVSSLTVSGVALISSMTANEIYTSTCMVTGYLASPVSQLGSESAYFRSSTLDLGIYGTYPLLEAKSPGQPFGDAGAFAPFLVITDSTPSGSPTDPMIMFYKPNVGLASLMYAKYDGKDVIQSSNSIRIFGSSLFESYGDASGNNRVKVGYNLDDISAQTIEMYHDGTDAHVNSVTGELSLSDGVNTVTVSELEDHESRLDAIATDTATLKSRLDAVAVGTATLNTRSDNMDVWRSTSDALIESLSAGGGKAYYSYVISDGVGYLVGSASVDCSSNTKYCFDQAVTAIGTSKGTVRVLKGTYTFISSQGTFQQPSNVTFDFEDGAVIKQNGDFNVWSCSGTIIGRPTFSPQKSWVGNYFLGIGSEGSADSVKVGTASVGDLGETTTREKKAVVSMWGDRPKLLNARFDTMIFSGNDTADSMLAITNAKNAIVNNLAISSFSERANITILATTGTKINGFSVTTDKSQNFWIGGIPGTDLTKNYDMQVDGIKFTANISGSGFAKGEMCDNCHYTNLMYYSPIEYEPSNLFVFHTSSGTTLSNSRLDCSNCDRTVAAYNSQNIFINNVYGRGTVGYADLGATSNIMLGTNVFNAVKTSD